ncbi:MAG: hypothetical protein KKC68_04325 [Candidatus Thermoplasmatota archaeon]|nr:hypothetical protein [Candidatus Thermoplasmatota archaeon]MBU1940977.1 hypothetical protein [Candidatus Thermoplasmatota archaeon]
MVRQYTSFIFHASNQELIAFPPDIAITSVTNSKTFKEFYQFPFSIYKKYPQWVPPLFMEYTNFFKKKNPFWTHATTQLYLAKRDDTVVGRIAVFIDRLFVKTYSESTGFFGFFESINDYHVSSALLSSAQTWLQKNNCTKMIGPLNGRIDIGCGFLVDGFLKPPSFQANYNPLYYSSLAEKFGMQKKPGFT